MKYLIVNNGTIENIISADEAFAQKIGALPYYDGAEMGAVYQPPEVGQVATQLDRIEAQIVYTAMMTDTLLEEEVYEEEN